MKLIQETSCAKYQIRGISEKGIQVNETYFQDSFIVSPDTLIASWDVPNPSEFTTQHFEILFSLAPELILIGTGEAQRFLPPKLIQQVLRRGIGLEVMPNRSVCRTYHVLASENRNFVAGIFQPQGSDV